MLRGLRKASGNWLGKSILAAVVTILIISFGIWGVGDMFRISARAPVASIGSAEITAEQFRQTFNDRIQALSRQVGRPVTPAQALSIGFDQQLLGQMLAEAAMDETARKMGLNVSAAEVAKRITTDPTFRGLSGEFDRNRFEQLIRQSGFTEGRFIAEQRRVFMRRQLVSALSDKLEAPLTERQAFARYEGEERSIDYITLTAATAGDIPSPTADVLAKYFEDRKITFRAPEYRKLIVLALTPDEISKSITVTDDDAKRFYEDYKTRFSTPEKRDVQQMVFPDDDAAKKAADQIAAGTSFEAIATERGLKDSDINLGSMTKAAIVDPAIAEAAFELKEGEISAPVKGRFGTALVRVTKIEPAITKSFTEVSSDIKQEIAADRARLEINKRRDKVEDELAGGARLDEAAQKAGTPVRTIAAVDRSGRAPDGSPVTDLPKGADILGPAFSTGVGVEADPVQAEGGLVWYEVAGITPARDRVLDEVKGQVEARWREDQLGQRLKTKADEIVAAVKAGKSFEDEAKGLGLTIDNAKWVKRSGNSKLSRDVVAAMFRTAKDAVGSADGNDPSERVVFKVTEIATPNYNTDSPDSKRISDTLRNALSDELLTQYVTQIENDLGTTINRSVLLQAVSAGGGN
ncbi:MAG: peptidyl-prolyl cis-trans isomerase [Xanthobacteraceae bacterium]